MRIACIGNMNHMLFTLTRYLRAEGHDAHLFLHDNEAEYFLPEADSYTDEYMKYTHQLNWGSVSTFATTSAQSIRNTLDPFDMYITSNTAPAFLYKAGLRSDIFIPHGSDIYGLPAWGQEAWHQFALWKLAISARTDENAQKRNEYLLSRYQRRGIKAAKKILINETNDAFEALLDKAISAEQRIKDPCPFVFTPQYNSETIAEHYAASPYYMKFKEIRERFDFVIFHHSRHVWHSPPNVWTQKGNDVLLRGFAQALSEIGDQAMCLVLFEYGPDVEHSKTLIAELGIESHVVWMPKMFRKDIMIGLSLADMGTGEFAQSWFSYGIVQEVLGMGKPLMHYRDDSLYTHLYPELYPMASAHTSKQVADTLKDLTLRPEYYAEMGVQGRQWYEQYMVKQPIDQVNTVIASLEL